MSDRVDVNRLLMEMRAFKAQTQAFSNLDKSASLESGAGPQKTAFNDVLTQAVNKVNEVQQASSSTTKAYLQGDPGIDVTDVMIASQKAGVAFDAMVQVRNKVVEAYRDVMNMPI